MNFMYANLVPVCQRKGSAGVELANHGQRGCVSPTGKNLLEALRVLKHLFLEGVRLEGLQVAMVFASSAPTIKSLGLSEAEHYSTRCDCSYISRVLIPIICSRIDTPRHTETATKNACAKVTCVRVRDVKERTHV